MTNDMRKEKTNMILKHIMLVYEGSVKCNLIYSRSEVDVYSSRDYAIVKLLDEYRNEYMSESVKELYAFFS